MKSVVFLAILVFVPFNLVYGDFLEDEYGIDDSWRPAFENPVETGFKDAHGKALGIKNFTPGRDHSLNHVYAWLSIRASINDEVEKAYKAKQGVSTIKKDLNELAEKIFETDSKAEVNFDYYFKKKTSDKHISYLRSGAVNGLQDLEDLNDDMLLEAKQHIASLDFKSTPAPAKNTNLIKELLKVLNSAPANLRYGESRTNSSIQDFLDLMGDSTGEPTTKEIELVVLSLQSSPRSIIKPETCSGVTGACIKSSTGTILRNKFYYMKCQNLPGIC